MKEAKPSARATFVLARHVSRGPWSAASGEAACARCGHRMSAHGAGGVGRCKRPSCSCSAFALWKGVHVSFEEKRFERELRRLGASGEAALKLWAKRRAGVKYGLQDAGRGWFVKLAGDLVKVAAGVECERVESLALVVVWGDGLSWEWVPMFGPGCAAAESMRRHGCECPSCEEGHESR